MFLFSHLSFPSPAPAASDGQTGRRADDTRSVRRGKSGRCLGAAVVARDRAEQGYWVRSTSGLKQGPRSVSRRSARRLYGWRAGRPPCTVSAGNLEVSGQSVVPSSRPQGRSESRDVSMSARTALTSGGVETPLRDARDQTTFASTREVSGVPRHLIPSEPHGSRGCTCLGGRSPPGRGSSRAAGGALPLPEARSASRALSAPRG